MGTFDIRPCVPTMLCTLLIVSGNQAADATSGKGDPPEKVCKTADAPTSSKSDMWRHSGYPVTGNEKGEKVADWK